MFPQFDPAFGSRSWPGDAVVLYTSPNAPGLDAEAIAGTIADAAMTWQEGRPRDDVAIVVLRVPLLEEPSVSLDSGRAP